MTFPIGAHVRVIVADKRKGQVGQIAHDFGPGDGGYEVVFPGEKGMWYGRHELERVTETFPFYVGDAGDENDYEPFADFELHVGEDYVREWNEHGNGFDVSVTVEEDSELLSKYVSFDLTHLADRQMTDLFVGVLMTPDAAYELANILMDAADIAEVYAQDVDAL